MTDLRLGKKENLGIRRLWSLLRGSRGLAGFQVGISLFEGFVEAAILTLFARIALAVVGTESGDVFVPALGPMSTQFTLGILVGLVLARLSCGVGSAYCMGLIQTRTVVALRREIISSYLASNFVGQSRIDRGGLQQLVVTTPNAVSGQLSGLLLHLGHLIIMISMLVYATLTYATLTLGLVLVITLMTVSFRPLRKWIKSRSTAIIGKQRAFSNSVADLSSLSLEIQAFGISHRMKAHMNKLVEEEGDLARRIHVVKGVVVPLYTTVTYLAVALGLVILSASSESNLALVGPILLVILRSLAYGQSIQAASVGLASLAPSIAYLDKEVARFGATSRTWGSRNLREFRSLEFVNVSYSYESSQSKALDSVSFEMKVGERIGIVGPSGGGKTTLTRLLLGLLEPCEGVVMVNGHPLNIHNYEHWSSIVGVVPQHPAILQGTIAENLRFFRSGIEDSDLWNALDIADLAKEVKEMPLGLESKLGEGGGLSGGQVQRLAIARALAARPNLIVMDEPTSSIDSLSEASVADAIARMPQSTSVVIVSHRMRILRGCGELIVIEDSRMTGKGRPDDVMSSNSYLASASTA